MEENLFLNIDGVNVDGIEEGDYTAYEQELGTFERMISGRMIEELRAKVWVIEVSYGDIDMDTLSLLTAAMSNTRTHQITFLPPNGSTELVSSQFHLTTLPQPTLSRWLPGTTPMWSGYTLHFEEINGHD